MADHRETTHGSSLSVVGITDRRSRVMPTESRNSRPTDSTSRSAKRQRHDPPSVVAQSTFADDDDDDEDLRAGLANSLADNEVVAAYASVSVAVNHASSDPPGVACASSHSRVAKVDRASMHCILAMFSLSEYSMMSRVCKAWQSMASTLSPKQHSNLSFVERDTHALSRLFHSRFRTSVFRLTDYSNRMISPISVACDHVESAYVDPIPIQLSQLCRHMSHLTSLTFSPDVNIESEFDVIPILPPRLVDLRISLEFIAVGESNLYAPLHNPNTRARAGSRWGNAIGQVSATLKSLHLAVSMKDKHTEVSTVTTDALLKPLAQLKALEVFQCDTWHWTDRHSTLINELTSLTDLGWSVDHRSPHDGGVGSLARITNGDTCQRLLTLRPYRISQRDAESLIVFTSLTSLRSDSFLWDVYEPLIPMMHHITDLRAHRRAGQSQPDVGTLAMSLAPCVNLTRLDLKITHMSSNQLRMVLEPLASLTDLRITNMVKLGKLTFVKYLPPGMRYLSLVDCGWIPVKQLRHIEQHLHALEVLIVRGTLHREREWLDDFTRFVYMSPHFCRDGMPNLYRLELE